MASFANGKIEVYLGPTELGAPHNLENEIIKFIKGAQESLDIAVQEIDSEAIAQAIIDARWAGVKVRVFVEHDYVLAEKPPTHRVADNAPDERRLEVQWEEFRRPSTQKTNRDIHMALLRNGVDIKADYNHNHIFHQKFIIRDRRYKTKEWNTSALLTGSTNFTNTGTHNNLNNVVIFNDPTIAWLYQLEFQEIRQGIFGKQSDFPESKPKTVNVDGVPVQILFAPDHSPEMEIMKQMLKCRKALYFAVFTFSGSSGIDDAMLSLRLGNIQVRGVVDPMQGRQKWAATHWLHNQGIELFIPRKQSGFGKLHHKLMVMDDNIVVAGSMNFTRPANEFNDENIFIIGSPYDLTDDEGGPVDHAECAKIATYFRTEIDRIITDMSGSF